LKKKKNFILDLFFFFRLVLLRLFRPDKIVPAVQQYIIKNMGQQFVEPPTFDLPGSYADSLSTTPLIFVLSPGADPMMALLKFGETMGVFDERIKTVSLGQGQVKCLHVTFFGIF